MKRYKIYFSDKEFIVECDYIEINTNNGCINFYRDKNIFVAQSPCESVVIKQYYYKCYKNCGNTYPSGGDDNICLNCGSSIKSGEF